MNALTKSEEERFMSIMNRTLVAAENHHNITNPFKQHQEVDAEYWRLLRLESTEELEWMIELHATGRLKRRQETFNVMLDEIAQRELLGVTSAQQKGVAH